MIVKVVATTDDKYVGETYDTDLPLTGSDGITFHPTKIQNLGDNLYRFSNSNYVVLAKEV